MYCTVWIDHNSTLTIKHNLWKEKKTHEKKQHKKHTVNDQRTQEHRTQKTKLVLTNQQKTVPVAQ
tara:strand:- start:114 stop:308 length:195 start_codon:yes stop_codon:yes gene_type:complete